MTVLSRPVSAISRISLADSVYETLLEAIVGGSLHGGAELNEVALAAELEVSRTPVHEALRRLAADGLVELAAGRKARVTLFGRDEVIDIYQMRKLLESEAARRAAEAISESQLSELRERMNALSAAEGDDEPEWIEQALQFDLEFHDAVARASGSERLRDDIRRYRLLVRSMCRITGSRSTLQQALREHEKILAALEARDAEAARQATTEHIDARLRDALRQLDSNSSPAKPR